MKSNKILNRYLQSNWDDLVIDVISELGEIACDLIIDHLKNDDPIPQKLLKNKKFSEYLEAMKTIHSFGITIYD